MDAPQIIRWRLESALSLVVILFIGLFFVPDIAAFKSVSEGGSRMENAEHRPKVYFSRCCTAHVFATAGHGGDYWFSCARCGKPCKIKVKAVGEFTVTLPTTGRFDNRHNQPTWFKLYLIKRKKTRQASKWRVDWKNFSISSWRRRMAEGKT